MPSSLVSAPFLLRSPLTMAGLRGDVVPASGIRLRAATRVGESMIFACVLRVGDVATIGTADAGRGFTAAAAAAAAVADETVCVTVAVVAFSGKSDGADVKRFMLAGTVRSRASDGRALRGTGAVLVRVAILRLWVVVVVRDGDIMLASTSASSPDASESATVDVSLADRFVGSHRLAGSCAAVNMLPDRRV